MRFKLSSLLLFVSLLAIAIGLGYQVHLLRQELAEVRKEIQLLKQRPVSVVFDWPATHQADDDYSVKRGMKVDELQGQRRWQRQRKI